MHGWGIFFVAVGIYYFVAPVFFWEPWSKIHPEARWINGKVGATATRVFYVIASIALVVYGALVAAGKAPSIF